jgi:hypothetical protein
LDDEYKKTITNFGWRTTSGALSDYARSKEEDVKGIREQVLETERGIAQAVEARDYMSENEHDQHVTAVRTAVRKAGEISRSDLVKRVHRQMDSRRLEGVIKMLIDGDMIHETRGPIPLSGGRGKTLYRTGPSPGTS